MLPLITLNKPELNLKLIPHVGDRHMKTGLLTVNEMRTFLACTPYEGSTQLADRNPHANSKAEPDPRLYEVAYRERDQPERL